MPVFAFCAEITRLPSHCEVKFAPVNATAPRLNREQALELAFLVAGMLADR